jgi:DNA-binding FadR family transcriptional regulator
MPRMARSAATPPSAIGGPPEARADANNAVRLAALIEEHIRTNGLAPGTNVGTRSQLAARYGVGPEIFRQSARLLEQRGIARVQRGKLGGLIVMAPRLDAPAHALATFLEFANVGVGDIGVVNEALRFISFEPSSRALTLADADDIRRRLAVLADPRTAMWQATFLTFDINQEIVDRIGNPIFSLLHQAVMLFLVDIIPLDLIARSDSRQALRQLFEQTSAITEALIANDMEAAQRFWLEARDSAIEQEAGWRSDGLRLEIASSKVDLGPTAERWTGRWTLADKVARELLRDIRARGWPEGACLGTETELLQAYGVSRATFRQAVRLLEHYSAAKMQRGPKGGLIVTAPDPEALIEASVADLWRAEARPAHARPLQIDLQTRAVDILCATSSATFLDALGQRIGQLQSLRGTPLRTELAELQRLLLRQCGNQALHVCWAVTAAVAVPDGIPRAIPDQRILAMAGEALAGLHESLKRQDRARARRAMLSYLAAEDGWLGL